MFSFSKSDTSSLFLWILIKRNVVTKWSERNLLFKHATWVIEPFVVFRLESTYYGKGK